MHAGYSTFGQQQPVYNINKYNGLTSNHVYCTLVDKYGYLWISTPDGVFRYNGYTFRKYDYDDGLPSVDVWNMYEDSKGRIWLLTIAYGLGYIENTRFHNVTIPDSIEATKVYPAHFKQVDSYFVFLNNLHLGGKTIMYGLVDDDTLYYLSGSFDPISDDVIILDTMFAVSNDSALKTYSIPDAIKKRELANQTIKSRPTVANKRKLDHCIIRGAFADKYTYYSNPKDKHITFYNPFKNFLKSVSINPENKGEYIIHGYVLDDSMTVLTNKAVYRIDSSLEVHGEMSYRAYFARHPSDFSPIYYLVDTLWGRLISTIDEGVYINRGSDGAFLEMPLDLTDYYFVGYNADGNGYWWKESENRLIIVGDGKILQSRILTDVFDIKRIKPYTDGKAIIFSNKNLLLLDEDGRTSNLLTMGGVIYHNSKKVDVDSVFAYIYYGSYDAVVKNKEDLYIVAGSWLGLLHLRPDFDNKIFRTETLDIGLYKNIFFYEKWDALVCYTNNGLLVYNISTGNIIRLTAKEIKQTGITDIQKICADSFGHFFIKDYSHLYMFDPVNLHLKVVLSNYNLKEAAINVVGNKLTVAGTFGVLHTSIAPSGQFYNTHTYGNEKGSYYNYISGVQFAERNVLLQTDNGSYLVNINEDTTESNLSNSYRLLLNYGDDLQQLHGNDTITVQQNVNSIGADVIRPSGTGELNIEYAINESGYTRTGTQIVLPDMAPGSYNTVRLVASDNSWRSKPHVFTVYIIPQWWQTTRAQRILFIILIILGLAAIYLIVLLTRRAVNNANEKRNQRRELELKSIYSQINPHFIFNSLSTAQYFVKKNRNKEAYEHIHQFSDLLRSYIKSSRNKYISIAEEIENLENYLQLQLTRFEEKFDYHILVDEHINAKQTSIPSLLLQPLVENALNHGIFHLEDKGELNIAFRQDDADKSTLVCIVDDNGIGRKKAKEIRSEKIRKADSYGTILIKELIDTFNKYEKISIHLEYIDKTAPETGTTVVVKIKKL